MKKEELRLITISIVLSILICILKFFTYFLTHSLVILSDALESIINIVAGSFAYYSIFLSAQPKDANHPYGHGKIEFFSIGFEGAMITIAGISIIYTAICNWLSPHAIEGLSVGLWLVLLSGLANYGLGYWLIKKGKGLQSLTLEGNGQHILSDSYSSAGVLIAIIVLYFTHQPWIDPLASIVAAVFILISGYKLLRKSVSGLMDEADMEVVEEVVNLLYKHRHTAWIDVHNMRVQRYGTLYHVDCHLTLPYYYDLKQVHNEIGELDHMVNQYFTKGQVEFFIHTDPCLPVCCHYCLMNQCPVRKEAFAGPIRWTQANVLPNRKHADITNS